MFQKLDVMLDRLTLVRGIITQTVYKYITSLDGFIVDITTLRIELAVVTILLLAIQQH